jgi:hypothetical protein
MYFSFLILIKGEEEIHIALLLFITAGETPSAPRKDKQCTGNIHDVIPII